MSELIPVLEGLLAEADAKRPAALCAVVATKGSAPQRPGAALLLRQDCSTLGTLGGGCVEQEVKRLALQSLTTGTATRLDFVLDHDYGWDDGLICGGRMEIAVVPLAQQGLLPDVERALAEAQKGQPAAFPLHVEHQGRLLRYDLHLEAAPHLLIAGAGHVGTALAKLAADLDFRITVVDDRADYADPARFPGGTEVLVRDIEATLRGWPLDARSYVVIVTRGHQHDHQALAAVVGRPARYIGLIGSKRKLRLIFDDLQAAGVSEDALAQVHSPIGLAIGGVTVPEIAVSIAAELIQVRRSHHRELVDGPFEELNTQSEKASGVTEGLS